MKLKNIVLIPAYEPTEQLIEIVKELRINKFDVLVVNDGSEKKYEYIFNQIANMAKIITHKENYGKGVAIKTGLKYIQKTYKENYSVITVDADGQHKISDVIKISKEAIYNPEKLILGSRSFDKKVPIKSKIGNIITRVLFEIVTKNKIKDTQTGLRGFSNRILPIILEVSGQKYEYEMNVLLEITKRKIEIKEVPIMTIYIDNNNATHFNAVKDSYKIYKTILKFAIHKNIRNNKK